MIQHALAQLQTLAEVVRVEGAGGLLIPLNARQNRRIWRERLALPMVLVVGMRLGCLNHALLTAGSDGAARFDRRGLGRQPD